MMLAVVTVLLLSAVVLFAFGNALGARGKHQRGADLAAISAAQVMRELYPRLFEPPNIEPDVPKPRHLEEPGLRAHARPSPERPNNSSEDRAPDVINPGSASSGATPGSRGTRGCD